MNQKIIIIIIGLNPGGHSNIKGGIRLVQKFT